MLRLTRNGISNIIVKKVIVNDIMGKRKYIIDCNFLPALGLNSRLKKDGAREDETYRVEGRFFKNIRPEKVAWKNRICIP
jgi:hypothetical protein